MSELAYQEMWACVSQESDPDGTLLRPLQEGVRVFLKPPCWKTAAGALSACLKGTLQLRGRK